MTEPLSVALVWHMHQPDYRDGAGRFLLPWVRRRASKDYVRMIETAMRHPGLRITMNMVPTLLEQLELYAREDFDDSHRELCLRQASELTPADRAFLLNFTRSTDRPRRVAMFEPFYRLLESLPADGGAADDAMIRDLQVWSLLVWLDPSDIERDPALSAIVRLGSGFDEEVKRIVDERQLARVRQVLPRLREAIASGCIEPMTSPYAHPILPLLIDQESAHVARPDLALPPDDVRFRRPEDAAAQVERGLAVFERLGGVRPSAIWPPECAMSPAAASLIAAGGVHWAISDEGVLGRSLEAPVRGDDTARARLYRPYRERSGLHMVFRDALLSNRIGFDYPSMQAADAVDDLVGRLEEIAAAKPSQASWLVVIALDGENCWDYYEDNGAAFLDGLYSRLTTSSQLRTVHVDEFLDHRAGTVAELEQLWSGSWVDADFATWIGEPAHTRAWTLLAQARSALDAAGGPSENRGALQQILIAEGSDWFWWFSSRHESGVDSAWDALFRTHLRRVYELIGRPAPADLEVPILAGEVEAHLLAPLRAIEPQSESDTDWNAAGVLHASGVFGAMQPARSSVDRIYFGASDTQLHIRFGDQQPSFERAEINLDAAKRVRLSEPEWTVAIPIQREQPVQFSVRLLEAGRGEERIPAAGSIALTRLPKAAVAVIAAECAPIAVGGDLADAVRTTVDAVVAMGWACVVILPHHRALRDRLHAVRIHSLRVNLDGEVRETRIFQGTVGDAAVLSVDHPAYFDRETIYGEPDDGARYVFFARAAVDLLEATALQPVVVHGFEWQSAISLALVAAWSQPRPATVLSVNGPGVGHEVPADLCAAAGVALATRAATVDLLQLGRSRADAVGDADAARKDWLSSLYAASEQRSRGGRGRVWSSVGAHMIEPLPPMSGEET